MCRLRPVAVLFAALVGASPALAAEPSASAWTITLGAEGGVLPSYEGSDRYVLRPLPLFDVRKAGTPPKFHSPREGIGFGLFDTGRFRVGPALKIRFPRREGDDPDLRGLGDVGWGLEAGAFVDFWPTPWLRTRGEVRQGIGAHHGIVGDVLVDAVVPVTPQLTLSGGPRLTLESDGAVSPYFDVSPAQALASGLPTYDAKGGVYSWGLGVQARYVWSPQWTTYSYVEYQRLTGDVGNSPLITLRGSRDQMRIGLGVTYSFDVPSLW
jgi:outer membrane protein